MRIEIQKLISLFNQTFEEGAWHGPTVMETLRGVTAQQAAFRLPDTHSIAELTAHMVNWRMYALKKLQGDSDYDVSDEVNFRFDGDWEGTLQELRESQNRLTTALASVSDSILQEHVPGAREEGLTFYRLLHGVIHHDLYHTGQIALLKKTLSQQTI